MSIFFIRSISAIIIVITILTFSSITIFIKWIERSNPWIPLIFTLAFLGGIIIIFIYIISISKNKNKKNKNKLPITFVFVSLRVWELKYGRGRKLIHILISSFFRQYLFLCFIITLILFISIKVINSPFKALKRAS